MALPAAAPALLIFGRRKIGALIVLAGVALAAVGFFSPLSSTPINSNSGADIAVKTPVVTITVAKSKSLALLTPGNNSAFDLLRHTFDHHLLNSGTFGSMLVDIALRGGIILIALGVLLCLVFNFLPLMRGVVGVAAGIGFIGTALVMGVILGEQTRTISLCAANTCRVDPHAGIWLIALGFAVALAGGALGALRPLAGLVSGITFALTGVLLGAGVAYLIIQQKVLDVATQIGHTTIQGLIK